MKITFLWKYDGAVFHTRKAHFSPRNLERTMQCDPRKYCNYVRDFSASTKGQTKNKIRTENTGRPKGKNHQGLHYIAFLSSRPSRVSDGHHYIRHIVIFPFSDAKLVQPAFQRPYPFFSRRSERSPACAYTTFCRIAFIAGRFSRRRQIEKLCKGCSLYYFSARESLVKNKWGVLTESTF